MKRTMLILIALGFFLNAQASLIPRAAGIGVRGAYRSMNDKTQGVHVYADGSKAQLDVGGGGFWVFFYSRLSERNVIQMHIGAVGKVNSHIETSAGEATDVTAIPSVLFGLQHDLFSINRNQALQPYLSFGAGPYWISDIKAIESHDSSVQHATVSTSAQMGGYLGGGANFMLTSVLGLNFDYKYHFIDLNVNHPYSGSEFGLGLTLNWGRFR